MQLIMRIVGGNSQLLNGRQGVCNESVHKKSVRLLDCSNIQRGLTPQLQ
jgi:hypothetical protein